MDLIPTASQTAGPYFHLGMTETRSVSRIAGPQTKGERVWLTCRVIDGDGVPVNDAMVEIWQADAEGKYNHPDDAREKTADPAWLGFGRMATAEDGGCEFETIRPGRVPGSGNALASTASQSWPFSPVACSSSSTHEFISQATQLTPKTQ